jgi:2'-5' RNA ligase
LSQSRLFFALWPPSLIREQLAAAGAALCLSAPARAVSTDRFHLTICFIGEVPVGSVARVHRIGRELRASAFAISLDAYEYWPKPKVVVAAARLIAPELQGLSDDLHRALAAEGFDLYVKRLRPHVTLAQRVAADPQLPTFTAFAWIARDFCLVQSPTGADQGGYTVVDTWPLLDKADDA